MVTMQIQEENLEIHIQDLNRRTSIYQNVVCFLASNIFDVLGNRRPFGGKSVSRIFHVDLMLSNLEN